MAVKKIITEYEWRKRQSNCHYPKTLTVEALTSTKYQLIKKSKKSNINRLKNIFLRNNK